MKIPSFSLPLAAFVVAGFWLIAQRGVLSRLEEREAALRRSPGIAGQRVHRKAGEGESPRSPVPLKADGHIDWQQVARLRTGDDDDIGRLLLRKYLLGLTPAELMEEYHLLAASGLAEGESDFFISEIAEMVALKDPRLALDEFRDRIRNHRKDNCELALSGALQRLATTDPAAATAWLDAALRDGCMDSTAIFNFSTRMPFEAALMRGVLDAGGVPDAQRLARFPASYRSLVFSQSSLSNVGPALAPKLIALWRECLRPGEAQAQLLSVATWAIQSGAGDADTAGTWVRAYGAEEEVRNAFIAEIASRAMERSFVDPGGPAGQLERLDAWARRDAPEARVQVMTQALAGSAYRQPLAAAADSIATLAGSDDFHQQLLTGLLMSRQAAEKPKEVRDLVERVSDPRAREAILAKLTAETP